jgi:hypothetical protein
MPSLKKDDYWAIRRYEKLKTHVFASKITKVPETVRVYTEEYIIPGENVQIKKLQKHDSLTADKLATKKR